jgi:hypothetical protein
MKISKHKELKHWRTDLYDNDLSVFDVAKCANLTLEYSILAEYIWTLSIRPRSREVMRIISRQTRKTVRRNLQNLLKATNLAELHIPGGSGYVINRINSILQVVSL